MEAHSQSAKDILATGTIQVFSRTCAYEFETTVTEIPWGGTYPQTTGTLSVPGKSMAMKAIAPIGDTSLGQCFRVKFQFGDKVAQFGVR
jgi:hypothetical protein